MYLAMKTRRARSPCFQSIKRVIGFSLKLSDCYAKFGAARLSLFSFPTPGGCVCFAFIMIFILKFIFYFTILLPRCLSPRQSDSGGRWCAPRGAQGWAPEPGATRAGLRNRAAPRPRAQLGLPAGIAPGGHNGEQQRKYINRITHHAHRGRIRNRPGKGT